MIIYNIIYLLIFFFFIYHVLKLLLKDKGIIKIDTDLPGLFRVLDYLYINNIFFTYFILVFYFCITFLLFLLFRIPFLGTSYQFINIYDFSYYNFINFFMCILCVQYYFKICHLLFYYHIIRIHFYLYYKSEFYVSCWDFIARHNTFASNIFWKASVFCYNLLLDYKSFLAEYRKDLRYNEKCKTLLGRFYWRFYLHVWYICNNFKFLKYILNLLFPFFNLLGHYGSYFFSYIHYTCLIMIVFYDFINQNIFYTYYALFIFYLINFIRNVCKFFYIKDPLCDYVISKYFYANEEYYKKTQVFLQNNPPFYKFNSFFMGENAGSIVNHSSDIINYISNDFTLKNIVSLNNDKYLNNGAKRRHIILLIIFFNIYLWFNYNKYLVILPFITVKLFYILLILLFIIYFIHRKILYEVPDSMEFVEWAENKYYKKWFIIILIFFIFPFLYIVLKNKVILMPNEVIFEFKNIILFEEIFSVEEKARYMSAYMDYLTKKYQLDNTFIQKAYIMIKENITNKELLLQDIRYNIEMLLKENSSNDDKISWFQKFWLWFTKK